MNGILKKVSKACEVLDPPLGVYLVDCSGLIVYCNQEFERILPGAKVGRKMEEFYADPSTRGQLWQQIRQSSPDGKNLLKEVTLHLRSVGGEVYARDFTRLVQDAQGQTVGLLCFMTEYTDRDRAYRLFKHLPVGFYGLDENDRVEFGNARLAALHGFQTVDELIGKNARDFYIHSTEFDQVSETLKAEGKIVDQTVTMAKKDGLPVLCSLTATEIRDNLGRYLGREGVLIDLSEQELFRELVDHLPLGLFKTRINAENEEIIEHCNDEFARLNGYERGFDLERTPIWHLHRSRASYEKHRRAIENASDDSRPSGERIEIKTRIGKIRTVESHSRWIKDRKGGIVGRVGASRDITEQVELEHFEKLVHDDFGNFLHTYSSNLLSVRHTLEIARLQMGVDPFKVEDLPSFELSTQKLNELRERLSVSLIQLLHLRNNVHQSQGFSDEQWDVLETQAELLDFSTRHLHLLNIHTALRESAHAVIGVIGSIQSGHIVGQLTRKVRQAAEELRRLSTLVSLHLAGNRLLEIGLEASALRKFVISARKIREPKKIHLLSDLVKAAARDHSEYARAEGVELRFVYEFHDLEVDVAPDQVKRAIGNIIHNSIKYSWRRSSGVRVDIRTLLRERFGVVVVENYGVPIAEDELLLVKTVGFRGRFSGDRRRAGTGFGLWDASQVAENHAGEVLVRSVQADRSGGKDYSRPFITTVEFVLPLAGTGSRKKSEK